jgi:hypothetical protein
MDEMIAKNLEISDVSYVRVVQPILSGLPEKKCCTYR